MKKSLITVILFGVIFLLSSCTYEKIKMKWVYSVTILEKSNGIRWNTFTILYKDSINSKDLYKSRIYLETNVSNDLNINNKYDSLLVESKDVN